MIVFGTDGLWLDSCCFTVQNHLKIHGTSPGKKNKWHDAEHITSHSPDGLQQRSQKKYAVAGA